MRAAPENLAEAVGEFMGALEHYHPHDEDCWYLPLIGVDPAHQGKGLGAALMKHATDLIDSQGALSYLESSTPQNISLYERHGFESTGQILFGEANNIATPMVRDSVNRKLKCPLFRILKCPLVDKEMAVSIIL